MSDVEWDGIPNCGSSISKRGHCYIWQYSSALFKKKRGASLVSGRKYAWPAEVYVEIHFVVSVSAALRAAFLGRHRRYQNHRQQQQQPRSQSMSGCCRQILVAEITV